MTTQRPGVDLLVIGGGVLGAFHAYHALERGLSVTLLERNSAARGATVRNFGQIVPSGLDARWQAFGRESLEIYRTLQTDVDLSIRQLGSIYLASDDDESLLLDELHAINLSNGYSSERWTAEQCRNRFPELRSGYCRNGLFFPQEMSVNPRVMIHQLHGYLKSRDNYQSHFQSNVIALEATGSGVIAFTSDGKKFCSQKAIVCSGSEFRLLFPHVFRDSDLTQVKLQMMRLSGNSGVELPGNILTGLSIRRYESFAQCPSWHDIKMREPEDTFWKRWGVHILFKQEIDGSVILGDSHEYLPASTGEEFSPDLRQDISDYFVSEASKIFELPSWRVEASWAGVYCQTAAESGIYTKTIDDNIHIVTGIGGKGMTSSAGYSRQSLKEIYND